ncbi:MAG TPA: hypothetical protein VMN36_17605 [Verrucomicrobiales bacterium]|nr:hypothetical protein [Verrucomicrobiales bacterium]
MMSAMLLPDQGGKGRGLRMWLVCGVAVAAGMAAPGCTGPEDPGVSDGGVVSRGEAAGPAGGWTLPVVLAQRDVASGARQSVYTVSATGRPSTGTAGQELRLTVSSVGYTFDAVDRHRREFTLRSGRSRTLAQLIGDLRGYFDAILGGAAEGVLVGKLGDVRFGGEARFFAVRGGARIVFLDDKGATRESTELPEGDLRVFRSLLDEAAGR